jgi:hypothetical protein
MTGQHEDYNALRIQKGLKPLTFRLLAAEQIDNPLLSAGFDDKIAALKAAGRTAEELKVKWAFHGTRESALKGIATYGLLRVGHSSGLNLSKATDADISAIPAVTFMSGTATSLLAFPAHHPRHVADPRRVLSLVCAVQSVRRIRAEVQQ